MADTEVYIESVDLDELVTWIEDKIGTVKKIAEDDELLVYHGKAGGEVLPIFIQKNVEDGAFVGVWFNSIYAPWETDAECARELHQRFGKSVQCDPGDEVKGQDMFLEISADGEQLVKLS
ncbi:hypothetical protein [Pleionea sp. CnH1-48]|uniref:hypothetical protein n=1 Tax=Pleionea sp. CnH1-48 TaxID=2954494 RepID=UPI002097C685|nr:hypothetical protein [Pleionea sp. CnH1-48]MCO7222783.1 hypothetical protein [Pleionea sp. CnH1-48]